eukprot:TRINITY_DN54796_c0_g1_i1.p1 TRINITY_DN54796_c0_g1~~TRINITY_DN54796_c0_g1_i1.p1  ORF type:complete len:393 (-),score=68.17 TRINITY_DN54796_c0_g1_i1:129-1232(-)
MAFATSWFFACVVLIRGNFCESEDCVSSGSLVQVETRESKHIDPPNAIGKSDNDVFHCSEALEEWRRGWSLAKIQYCCEHEQIACDLFNSNVAPETRGELMEPRLALTNSMDIVVEVDTSSYRDAGTISGATMAFQIGTDWTEDMDLCGETVQEEIVARMVRLPAWPNKLRINALGGDAWGYKSIFLYFTDTSNNTAKVVLLNTSMNDTYAPGSAYWVDGAGEAPSVNTYVVPEFLPHVNGEPHCKTRVDPRVHSMMYETSPEGTECVFGVDDADEGSHCIFDDGQFGSFGWCYTSKDRSSWGSCDETCPLVGPFKILGTKVNEVLRRLQALNDALRASAMTSTSAPPKAKVGNVSTASPKAKPSSH